MRNTVNLLDNLLAEVKKKNILLNIYFKNNYVIRGYLKDFNSKTIKIDKNGKNYIIHKNAFLTAGPEKVLKLKYKN